MFDFAGFAQRMVQRIAQTSSKGGEVNPGLEEAVDGSLAVALTEAGVSDALVAGPTHAWVGGGREILRPTPGGPENAWGRRVRVLDGGGEGDVLASAYGLALSGSRTAAFLSGTELASTLPLLIEAVERRVPLVVQLVSQSQNHDAVHGAVESGATVWVAANVQEAVDFSLLARRVAEEALLPSVMVMDGQEIAFSVQNVLLPDRGVAKRFVGDPAETVHPPSPSQEILFGKHRRRLPKWHDPERPFLTGPALGSREVALGHAGRFAYLDPHLPILVESAFEQWEAETGRRHQTVSAYRIKDADVVLISLGGAVEALEAAADRIRRTEKLKVGVLGIRLLRPFPAGKVAEMLRGKKTVAVLERIGPHLTGDPPLLRDVRGALSRAVENARFGKDTHPGIPALDGNRVPRLASVHFGFGEFLRNEDLSALCREITGAFRSPIFLGVEFNPENSAYPKRQVLLGALRRYYPGSENLGLKGAREKPVPFPPATVVDVHRMSGHEGEGLAGEAARLLWQLGVQQVRSQAPPSWDHWGAYVVDRLVCAPEPGPHLGGDAGARVVLWRGNGLAPPPDVSRNLLDGGSLVLERNASRSFWESLPEELQRDILDRNLKLFAVNATESEDQDESILGALIDVLRREQVIDITPRKLLATRRSMMEDAPETRRESRLARFQIGLDSVMEVETGGLRPSVREKKPEAESPRVVRRLRRTDDTLDSLSRFWDQVGVLYQRGEAAELAPDPYLGVGVMPPLSSAFRDLSPWREMLPAFDPEKCTGCGNCWSVCPDSAMTPMVQPTSILIETGMKLGKERGQATDVLRRYLSKLAGQANMVMAEASSPTTAGAILTKAFSRFVEKNPLPADKKTEIEDAFAAVRDALGDLPLTATPPFFDDPETTKKGSGEPFSLAVSPDACKGCALCVAVCDPGALTSVPQDPERIREARGLWELFESLPDPRPETQDLARGNAQVGPVASALLTREVREAFSGGDGAEPGSGEKVAFRQFLAVAHDRFRPRHREHVARVRELRDKLSEAIRGGMAEALPAGNLDALSKGLGGFDRSEVNLTDLSQGIEEAFDSGRVDVTRLKRLVEIARAVNDLEWGLTEGAGGLGESPFGLVIGPGSAAAWASAYPNNPFGVPAVIHTGRETAALARGLMEGQLERGLDSWAVLRRATLELEDVKEAARAGDIKQPAWRDLTSEERKQVPPLFLIVCENTLAPDLGGLLHLLTGDLPVKVLVLTELDLNLGLRQGSPFPMETAARGPEDLGLLTMAHGNAFVAQTSIAHPGHLDKAVSAALDFDGPALIRIYTPSPERHGLSRNASVARAEAAVASRVFPLFCSNPKRGRFHLDLDGNPDANLPWTTKGDEAFTPVHWARKEKRFAHHFQPAGKDAEGRVPLSEFLSLDSEDRAERVAVVTNDRGERFEVGRDLVERAEECAAVWHTLSRLAEGLAEAGSDKTPAALESEATQQIHAQHDAELSALRGQYETHIEGLSDEMRVGMALQVRSRLLALLQQHTGNGQKSKAEEDDAS